jgi:endonuclease/exonuclease/phosphatase family metal-dependent hydrolase
LGKYIRKILFWINLLVACSLFTAYMANFINPAKIWQIAFFGLAYPALLLINIGFIIFWIWQKKMLALISAFVIVAGWTNVGRYIQIRAFEKSFETGRAVKLLSYNVRAFSSFMLEDGSNLLDSVLAFVNEEGTDILCFQEFYVQNAHEKQSEAYIDSMFVRMPYKHIRFYYKPSQTSNYGLATYSKYPIINEGSLTFENSTNSCLYTDMVIHNDTIRVYNAHLQSIKLKMNGYNFADSLVFPFNSKRVNEVRYISGRLKRGFIKRAEQVDILSAHIRRSPYKVVVCGDFNDTPVSYTYQKIRGDLKDAFIRSGKGIGNTYRGNFPSFRIDFIFHSRDMGSSDYRTHRLDISDHYPVSCSFWIEE